MDDRTDSPTLGPLGHSLGLLLRLAQLANFQTFYNEFKNLQIRPGEFTIMILIDENPGVRQGALARRLAIKRAHMTKIISAMEDRGIVRRVVSPNDRRSNQLYLTEVGRERLAQVRGPILEYEAGVAGKLTRQEQSQLIALLRKYLEIDD